MRAPDVSGPGLAGRTRVIETERGRVRGFQRAGVWRYLGIPFAAPPVGADRWTAPRPHDGWTGTLDAQDFGPACAQNVTAHGFASPSASEDCLHLNIFVDAACSGSAPVMVWFHGGGLVCGSAAPYDPEHLVQGRGVVLVTVNYRLNIFGFFGDRGFASASGTDGNYGFLDQQLALAWVRANIHAFGGDEGNLTIFGESGGARSVEAHLCSPGSEGLFERAIIQSSIGWERKPIDPDRAHGVAGDFAAAAGLGRRPSGLRGLSVEALLRLNQPGPPGSPTMVGPFSVGPIVGGESLPLSFHDAFTVGAFHRVPIIRGMNHDEARWFIGLEELSSRQPLDDREVADRLVLEWGDDASEVAQRYPADGFDAPSLRLARVRTDATWLSPERRCLEAVAVHTSVYAYLLDVPDAPVGTAPVSFPYGSAHSADLPLLFTDFHGATGPPTRLGAHHRALAEEMATAWTTFAATGIPRLANETWLPVTAGREAVCRLATSGSSMIFDFADRFECDFWDSLGPAG